MTRHQDQPQRDPLLDIRDAAEALTDPRHHTEPRFEWDDNRHRKPIAPHTTVVPGLIQQLRDMAEPGTDGQPGRHGGAHTAPVAVDAVSLLAAITFGAAWRCSQYGLTPRPTPEANIRALVGNAPTMDADDQHIVSRELRSWRNQADVITGWKTPPRELRAPCPACEAPGSLLADADGTRARCVTCNAEWDHTTIGLLARHVSTYRAAAEAASQAVRARAVRDRRQRENAGVSTPRT